RARPARVPVDLADQAGVREPPVTPPRRAAEEIPMPTGQLFIAGAWRPPVSGETYQTINPATEEPSATVAKGDERDTDLAVAAARAAFERGPWPRMTAAERGRIVWKLGDLVSQHRDGMARLHSLTTGQPLFDPGKVQIPFAAEVFRYY